ncbi:putative ribonuclease H protein [Vitis vinifera]|uniref:Putative ribonuclease H protein n=1 Tax=Vitis vinifera TaxID=29760 RepID=A0A438FRC2_VITVI|nr:putative ribonuclease H protein [Vitis vinifera]
MPRVVARRLEKLQRDFLWGGGSTERKAHLVNWERVCVGKEKGGLGLRKLVPLNKALLGKWVWRFAHAREEMWKRVLVAKYEQEEFGWRTKKVNGAFGVGVWKEIMKEADWCWDKMNFKVGKGTKIRFWKDPWCGEVELARRFPQLFNVAAQRSATESKNHPGGGLGIMEGGKNGKFEVKEAYELLISHSTLLFPKKGIWVENVPSKLAFFAWEATWGRVLTLDRLQKRGWQLPNRCYLCGMDEENVNHLLIHCTVASVLWGIVLGLFGVQWVFPETVKEAIISWKGSSSIKVVDEQSGTVHLVGSHYISSACSLSTRSAIIMLLLTTMLYTLVY